MSDIPNQERKNVLVTGGAGFIGSFLCERLLRDSNVICIDNFITSQHTNINPLLKNPNFEFINADISKPIDLADYPELERFKIRVYGIQEVYNLACPTSPKQFDMFVQQTLLANSIGTKNVLDLAVKYRAKFFQASTAVVYGPRPEESYRFEEDEYGSFNHISPRSAYDEGKRFSETMCMAYRDLYGLNVCIGRIFRTYGPRMTLGDGHMIPDFIMNALDGQDLVIFGDMKYKTSLIYVSDVVDAMVTIMRSDSDEAIFNIGSEEYVRLADVAQMIVEMTDSESKLVFIDPLPHTFKFGVPNMSKLRELGWIPLVTLKDGLSKAIEYTTANKHILR